ncbi:S41 family peptidase [Hydrogenovibrio kuenenii]|uniref:S41 family peptidase n=1 Tax=Hydrogenovibrio kuenenii TaxID=63658 RepID=UPI0004ACF9CA
MELSVRVSWAKKGLWLSTGAILGAFIVLATSVFADNEKQNGTTPATKVEAQLPLNELRSFVEVFERISKDYVEPVDDKKLLEGAISGMLSSLDPHSAYLSPKNFKEMEEHTTGEFGGLGMEVGLEDGFVKVVSPIDDTPAQKAGVKAGDLIIKLNDEPVKGKTLAEAVKIMRGKPGSKIKLTIVREGATKPLVLELTRAVIKVTSVKQKLLPNGMGYVRISQFQLRTGPDLIKAIKKLDKENKKPLNGLVLDLRNNPGGVLRAAVQVADSFINSGLIVYTKGRVKDSQLRFEAEKGDILKGRPMVVLINEGSASASEIVAGALQDQKRALIAGRNSFGKGSVQTLMPLNNGGAIKLTTARYYTPSGRSIQAKGIVPDVEIDRVKVEKLKAGEFGRIKEKDLSGHLVNDTKPKGSSVKTKDDVKGLLANDFELYEALSLLKGMYFTQQMGSK